MPIKSYLAYPATGRRQSLAEALRGLPGCEVTPSTNRDLMVLVTDTRSEAEEQALGERLRRLPDLACLAMVAGFADPDTQEATDGAS